VPKITYKPKKFSADRLEKIGHANSIIEEYAAKGFELTLRQLFYQFVSRGLLANSQREYKNLGDIISDARLAGLIDWLSIVDRTRELKSVNHWDSPESIVAAVAAQFRIDKWSDQPNRVEVWVEKDALVGVLEGVCTRLDVSYFSCRGYTSQSEMWVAGRRLMAYRNDGQDPIVLHLGDHDPSGIDMSRDIKDRLEEFSEGSIELQRLALNMPQIEQYEPPPNPAKITDSRAEKYIQEHGEESWELDALSPEVIAELIEAAVLRVRDEDLWDGKVAAENVHREQLQKVSEQWKNIVKKLK
jgi:hypothetical protein